MTDIQTQYHRVLASILEDGEPRQGRNGHKYKSLFGLVLDADLRDGFPVLTTKRVYWRAAVAEMLWFLSGSTNIAPLHAQRVTIWDEWADADGDLGPVYGKQWRDFGGVDQIRALLASLRNDPTSRRHVVSAWNPGEMPQMALPPCHALWQCFASADGHLDLQMYQRSADWFLGVPFNVVGYAALLSLLAKHLGMNPRRLRIVFGDAHVYENHEAVALQQLDIRPAPLPALELSGSFDDVFGLDAGQFCLVGYRPGPVLKAEVAV